MSLLLYRLEGLGRLSYVVFAQEDESVLAAYMVPPKLKTGLRHLLTGRTA